MKVVEKIIVSKRVKEAGCGSVVEYFDITKGVVYTCIVGESKNEHTYLLVDVVSGKVFEVNETMGISHYTNATLHLEG